VGVSVEEWYATGRLALAVSSREDICMKNEVQTVDAGRKSRRVDDMMWHKVVRPAISDCRPPDSINLVLRY
jgi:hypothetical protein